VTSSCSAAIFCFCFVIYLLHSIIIIIIIISGVGTGGSGGSGGSMNRGPELLGPPSSGATENFLGKTLRKIIKIVATDDGF